MRRMSAMGDEIQTTVSRLVHELQNGNRAALDELFPLIYEELRALAHRQRRRWHGDTTLNTTALVHELYLKLDGQKRMGSSGRAHFSAVASKAMRHILSNYAREHRAKKRGDGATRVSLDEMTVFRKNRTPTFPSSRPICLRSSTRHCGAWSWSIRGGARWSNAGSTGE